MQQRISTSSVINILDTVIRSANGYALPEVGGIAPLDPWDTVLTKLEPYALDPATVVDALRNALSDPNADNPLVTVSHYENRFGTRGFILVGPPESGADFETVDETGFTSALTALPASGGWILALPGTYVFSSTLTLSANVRLLGVHPESTTFETSGDFAVIELKEKSLLERVRIDGSNILSEAAVILSGADAVLKACFIFGFGRAGVQVIGSRAQVLACKIYSNATYSSTNGVIFQGTQQIVDTCSFQGILQGGAVVFENKECALLHSLFASVIQGAAFKIASPSLTDNRIVGNHFDSEASVAASQDIGTNTVRYANTPNALSVNLNNSLDPLKKITGQPSLTSTQMVLSNSFTHDPLVDTDAASIWSQLDLFVEKTFEERNITLDCGDPVFTATGAPSSGVFTWDGATNTLTYPTFSVRSAHQEDLIGTYPAGSIVVPANSCAKISLKKSADVTIGTTSISGFTSIISGTNRKGTVFLAQAGNLSKVKFKIARFLLTQGTFTAELYAVNQLTKLPTTLLASSNSISYASISDDGSDLTEFTFSVPVALTNEFYAIAFVAAGTVGTFRYWEAPTISSWTFITKNGTNAWGTHTFWNTYFIATLEPQLSVSVQALPLSLDDPNQKVLLYALPSAGKAVWLDGKRLLPSGTSTSFDVQGHLLPVTQYVGVTESRNPAPIFDGFGGQAAANITDKLSAHSALLENLVERSNLQYTTESEDCRISTDPVPGSWYDASAILNGIPSAPTHLLNVQGTLYGLVPASGVYYFDRPADGWRLVTGNPAGTGPFVSLSRHGTGLALLLANGNVVAYSPDSGWGTVITNQLTNVTTPMATTSPASPYYEAGQVDFAMQTENYTIFTTVGGDTLRFSADRSTLEKIPRVFTEAAGTDVGLLTYHPKDTGYNMAMNPETLGFSGDNGGMSKLSGLPLSRYFHGEILVDPALSDRQSLLAMDWTTVLVENFAFCQPNGSFQLVACDNARTTFYIFVGGPGTARLVSVLATGAAFTPMSWVLNPLDQAIYLLGTNASSALVMYRGAWSSTTVPSDQSWGSGRFTFTLETIDASSTYTGVIAGLDLYNQDEGTRDVMALATDANRSNRPTWLRYSRTNATWTKKTLTDESPTAATDVQTTWAVANIYSYNHASDQTTPGNGVASPVGFSFLIKSGLARAGRPTLFRWVRETDTFQSAALGGVDGIALSVADSNGYLQGLGALYHPTFKALMWLGKAWTNQVKLYTLFESAASTPTVWSGVSIGSTGATYLSTTSLGTYSITKRSGSMISRTFGDRYLGTDSISEDVYFYAPSQGIVRGVLNGGTNGFSSQTWSVVNKRTVSDPLIFSSTPSNTYSPLIGLDRMGDMSFQIGSLAEPTLPLYGHTMNGRASDYEGLFWIEPGTIVRNMGFPWLWSGLNRNGYLWIGNARSNLYGPTQVEYTPNPLTVRGDVTITGLPACSGFDWAVNQDQTKIAFAFRPNTTPSYIHLATYDIATESLTLERGNVDITGSAFVSLSSTPQIVYNSVANSWDIVAQDDTRTGGGQFVFYRKNLSTGAWLGERIGSNGDKLLTLVAQTGKTPSLCTMPNGNVLVASESGVANAQITMREESTGNWSSIYTSSLNAGFTTPVIVRSGSSNYYVFGAIGGGGSGVLASNLGSSSWSVIISPLGTPNVYCRINYPSVYSTDQGVYVASTLSAETGTTNGQEIGTYYFGNDGGRYASALAAKGRLATNILSGREEFSFRSLSWTHQGDLLYGAIRPGKTAAHWSMRKSFNSWKFLGESIAGPGRLISIGAKQYRESFNSSVQSANWIVTEWPSLTQFPILPLGTRSRDEIFGIRWFLNSSTNTRLFWASDRQVNNVVDNNLPQGTMAAVGSRSWPRIYGNTQGILSGGAVFGAGSGVRIAAPTGSTDASYFGVTIPQSGLLRLRANAALTFHGNHSLYASDDEEQFYKIQGPYTILLTQDGQHLVLDFPVPSSLTLDATANPLSYWSNYEHPVNRYAIVLGQNKDNCFLLAPRFGGRRLIHGNLEPREVSALDVSLENRKPYPFASDFNYALDQIPTGNLGRFKFKIIGSNHGIQSINFASSSLKQLSVRGPFSLGLCFFELTSDRLKAVSTVARPILTSHTSGGVVVLGE